jgi:hypothetical protein
MGGSAPPVCRFAAPDEGLAALHHAAGPVAANRRYVGGVARWRAFLAVLPCTGCALVAGCGTALRASLTAPTDGASVARVQDRGARHSRARKLRGTRRREASPGRPRRLQDTDFSAQGPNSHQDRGKGQRFGRLVNHHLGALLPTATQHRRVDRRTRHWAVLTESKPPGTGDHSPSGLTPTARAEAISG